jgi:hypothetical protein
LPHWQAKDIRTLSCANADNNTYRLCLHWLYEYKYQSWSCKVTPTLQWHA